MFFKGSRYKNIPEYSVVDTSGKTSQAKSLRWIPDTPGTFMHTVKESDRLDLLAYKYYGDAKKWWLISDANPEFKLPTDMIDRSPIVEVEWSVKIEAPESEEKWPQIESALNKEMGIQRVRLDREKGSLNITYNTAVIDKDRVQELIKAYDLIIENPIEITRPGKKIIIPPNRIV